MCIRDSVQMDARQMDFESGSFDCIVDKGTLDAILCGEGSTTSASKMLSEVYRVLNNKGVYLMISYGQPEHRLCYLEKPAQFDWSIVTHTIPKPTINTSLSLSNEDKDSPSVHYIYVCKRNPGGRKPDIQKD
eukprot:TRINITY_DN190_c0_g1_i3.p1 TRINITY_DN190_c0_g1~~TRINITY_DN190_c0_g1_i3.p1  ORF type:complete len:132 (+),score=22.07 TRINITY_DN190_c0_g1_i3:84-479(+)